MAESKNNVHKDHRKRLRSKYEKYGLESFEEHNILELLLFHSIPRADTNVTAHELINTFGSLYDVLCASREELIRVKGVGPASANLIRTVADTAREANLRKLSAAPIADFPHLLMYATEWFIARPAGVVAAVFMNEKMRIVQTAVLSAGRRVRTASYANSIKELSEKYDAKQVVLMHNHANGVMKPSDEDLYLTQQLYQTLADDGIRILEHLIVHKFDCIPILDTAMHQCVSGFPLTLSDEEADKLLLLK